MVVQNTVDTYILNVKVRPAEMVIIQPGTNRLFWKCPSTRTAVWCPAIVQWWLLFSARCCTVREQLSTTFCVLGYRLSLNLKIGLPIARINPVDFSTWGALQELVYQDVVQLNILVYWQHIGPGFYSPSNWDAFEAISFSHCSGEQTRWTFSEWFKYCR